MKTHCLITDRFYSGAADLRREFDRKLANPKTSHSEELSQRLVWDYWNVPDQYTLLRTPAYSYFSKKAYTKFHKALLEYGRSVLGCFDVTLPWLSLYVEGCRQEVHADVPHGPWAFVYSLTPWEERLFTGGETWMMKPETLQYWHHFSSMKGVEKKDLITEVPANFNRLTVFDPRLPHGVREVRGARDPREGRLVIHGWFKDPEPYVTGALTRNQGAEGLNEVLERLAPLFDEYQECHGTLSYRFEVGVSGKVSKLKQMTSTVQSLENRSDRVDELEATIEKEILKQKFAKAKAKSQITFPILFRF